MAASESAGAPHGAETGPLKVLHQQPGLPLWGHLPADLHTLYGGGIGFREPCVYGNFVSSIDGVVALGPEHPSSGSTISGREPADRFVMGLLRACAGAVLIGAGTLRATPAHRWIPEHVYPAAAAQFAQLRRDRGLPPEPELVVVTASGRLPLEHPALKAGAVIATTSTRAALLGERLPPTCTLLLLGEGAVLDPADVLDAVHARGHATVLTEAGPHLVAQLVERGLLDELFVTVAPVLAGRDRTPRAGLIAGLELLPTRRESAELASIRQTGSYLFLRYLLGR